METPAQSSQANFGDEPFFYFPLPTIIHVTMLARRCSQNTAADVNSKAHSATEPQASFGEGMALFTVLSSLSPCQSWPSWEPLKRCLLKMKASCPTKLPRMNTGFRISLKCDCSEQQGLRLLRGLKMGWQP